MKFRITNGKCYISLVAVVISLLSPVTGLIDEDEPLIPIDGNEDWVTINGNKTDIHEGKPKEDEEAFRFAEINHNGAASSIILSGSYPQQMRVVTEGNTAFLELTSMLDFESRTSYALVLTQDGRPKPLILQVVDINDNPPHFNETCSNEARLFEDQDLANTVLLCKFVASDPDAMDKDYLRYSITETVSGRFENFNLHSESGEFTLEKTLDYLDSPMHRFEITVTDSPLDSPIHSTPIIFTVNVVDVPDLPPVWSRFKPSVSVTEGDRETDLLQTIEAKDGDIQVKCDLNYEIEFANVEMAQLFQLDPISGDLTVEDTIDATAINKLIGGLVVEATVTVTEKNDRDVWPEVDYPNLNLIDTLQITVNDINDRRPEVCVAITDSICTPQESLEIVVAENTAGTLAFKFDSGEKTSIYIQDLDPTPRFSTFSVELFAIEPYAYVLDALTINPKRGVALEEFSISTKSTGSLNYEEDLVPRRDDQGKWWYTDPVDLVRKPKTVTFQIIVKDEDDSNLSATQTVTLTVTDINDNAPLHQFNSPASQEYTFSVCEDVETGFVLNKLNYDPSFPVCPDGPGTEEEHLAALDDDISKEFGTDSVEFLWSSSNKPPLDLDIFQWTMTVNFSAGTSSEKFNYERITEQLFTVVAIDEKDDESSSTRQSSNAVVKLVILDVNDTPVDLQVRPSRITIPENSTDAVFGVEIIAEDVDLQACVKYDEIEVEGDTGNTELNDAIKTWFKIEFPDTCTNKSTATIELGNGALPDREGCDNPDCPEVDRVDVIITARDTTTVHNAPTTSLRLTIEITDINDNEPIFLEIPDKIEFAENVCEESASPPSPATEDPSPICETDNASPYNREIASFRVTDRDKDPSFEFTISSDYAGMVDLVELEPTSTGRVVLRRKQGRIIDREYQGFYDGDTDFLKYTISVDDGKFITSIDITIDIEDINDNDPIFVTENREYQIIENESGDFYPGSAIFYATDLDRIDRYGLVSYKFEPAGEGAPGEDQFEMGLSTGILRVKQGADTSWHRNSIYNLKILAIDNYRPSSSSFSNTAEMTISVTVIDVNDNSPQFMTSEDGILDTKLETQLQPGGRFDNYFQVADNDSYVFGNGNFNVMILEVTCSNEKVTDPGSFFQEQLEVVEISQQPSVKNYYIHSAKSFQNNWGIYTLSFQATDLPNDSQPRPLDPLQSTATYKIEIKSENLHAPEFLYPIDNSTKLFIDVDAPFNTPLTDFYENEVPLMVADDEDDKSTGNGQLTVTLDDSDEEVRRIFRLVPSGPGYSLQIAESFSANNKLYEVVMTATDKGEPESLSVQAKLFIQVVPDSNSPPLFRLEDGDRPLNLTIKENEMATRDITIAHDLDLDVGIVNDTVYYYIVGETQRKHFRLTTTEIEEGGFRKFKATLGTIEHLDREVTAGHSFYIFVSNNEAEEALDDPTDPEDLRYLLVNIKVEDVKDVAPTFVVQGVISAAIEEKAQGPNTNKWVTTIEAIDLDEDDILTFEIIPPIEASDDTLKNIPQQPPILLDGPSGNLSLSFNPESHMRGFFNFTVKVTDTAFMSATANCRIYVITESVHVVKFEFQNTRAEINARRDELASILSEVFQKRCNIDDVAVERIENNEVKTTVTTHFIDLNENTPVNALEIQDLQFSSSTMRSLQTKLTDIDLIYGKIDSDNQNNRSSEDNLVTYFLIAGIAIVGVILTVSSVMWYFNNRSLTRRVRALTATAFGSQQSGLNRAGATVDELPNTNRHTVQGSNPVWTTQGEKKMPDFDTESIGSGGSVLIGAEDEDYFKNYKGTDKGGMGMSNPLFNMNVEDADNDFGSAMYSENDDDSINYVQQDSTPYSPELPYDGNGDDYLEDVPMPAVSRRNPLMNMDMNLDDSDS